MQNSRSDSYAKAGVDVTAGYESVERIAPHVRSTYRPGVLGDLGGFGGLFEPNLAGMKRPVTVSGTDGVGTKLKIAFLMDKHDTVGIDCVAMCVNDIVCSGAEPVFFLDYVAMGKNIPARTERIVAGVADGCRAAGCALIGGESAEMPGFYPPDEYDLAGFSVGFVDYDRIIDGSKIAPGDVILGLHSSGLHSNGYSLVRSVLDIGAKALDTHVAELGCTLGEELLRPTRIYVKSVLALMREHGVDIKGVSHITGGGLYENVPRMLPPNITAKIDVSAFPAKPIFSIIASKGNVPKRDMYNTFNMGIGMTLVVGERDAQAALAALSALGESACAIGECASGERGVELTW